MSLDRTARTHLQQYQELAKLAAARRRDVDYERRMLEIRREYLAELEIKREQQQQIMKIGREDLAYTGDSSRKAFPILQLLLYSQLRESEIPLVGPDDFVTAQWKHEHYVSLIAEVKDELKNREQRLAIHENELEFALARMRTLEEKLLATPNQHVQNLMKLPERIEEMRSIVREYEEALNAAAYVEGDLGAIWLWLERLQGFMDGILLYGDTVEDHLTLSDLQTALEAAKNANKRLSLLAKELRDIERPHEPYARQVDLTIYNNLLDYFDVRHAPWLDDLSMSVKPILRHVKEQQTQVSHLVAELRGNLQIYQNQCIALEKELQAAQAYLVGQEIRVMAPERVDWSAVRKLFPAAERYVYLNTSGGGCMSVYAAEAAKKYYDDSVAHADLKWPEWLTVVEATRQKIAKRWSAAVSEIGFVSNLSLAMNGAAALFASDKREVLTMADEFPSVSMPWLQQGYPVRFVESNAEGVIPIEQLAAALSDQTRYLVTSSVQFSTGFRQDLAALGRLCMKHDLLLIVDATQEFGAFPIDVQANNIAFLAASTYKWTTAGYGVAPFFVKQELLQQYGLPFVGWRSSQNPYGMVNDQLDLADTAQAIESGHPPIAGVLALSGALRLFDEVGEAAIAQRLHELTDYLHQQLDAAGLNIVSPRERVHRAAITMVAVDDNQAVAAALAERHIYVSARGAGLRVATHLYNNQADIDAFVSALADIIN